MAQILNPLIRAGKVATCGPVASELLWSTRNSVEFADVRRWLSAALEPLPILPGDWDTALDVQARLWDEGLIRCVGLNDLLIAAVAARHQVSLLHYDADFDRIARVTGQATRWVVPRGSVELP